MNQKTKLEYGSNLYIKRKNIDDIIEEEEPKKEKVERKGFSFKSKIKKRK